MRKGLLGAIALGSVALLAGGWFVADRYFLPAGTVQLDEEAPGGAATREGTLQGRAGHSASGQVALVQDGQRWLLHFTDLQMSDGPDIYLYATPSPAPTSAAQIDAGWRIPVVTSQDEAGRINERGTFSVEVPSDVDVDAVRGIGVWCERFGVPFATAELGPVDG